MSSAHLLKFGTVKPASIEWRENIPFSREFDDIYFNPQDGLAESEYVFLAGNNLPDDWINTKQSTFHLAELGFGSGLNFLMTLDAWIKALEHRSDKKSCWLNYLSIEMRPFTRQDFIKATQHWPQFAELVQALSENYPSLTYGRHQIRFEKWQATLTLFLMPAEDAINDLVTESQRQQNKLKISHWFFDGFAPSKNESMWGEKLCQQVARLSTPGTKLATFSVSAAVKTPLKSAGFDLSKRKGFGRKREMLTAIYHGDCETQKSLSQSKQYKSKQFINIKFESPWLNITQSTATESVAVIGAGVAGCATAYELSRAGFKVSLFDTEKEIANKASGAAAGIFHPQLTADMNVNSQFNWLAYLYLLRFLDSLDHEERSQITLRQGTHRLLPDSNIKKQLWQLAESLRLTDWISESSVFKSERAIFFPHSAALDMKAFCYSLINRIPSQQISFFLGEEITQIKPVSDTNWQLTLAEQSYRYQHLVICGGANSKLADKYLASKTNTSRGQTCLFNSAKLANQLKQTICEQTYLVPRPENNFHLGTTFENFTDNQLNADSQKQMFAKAMALFKELDHPFLSQKDIEELPLQGTVGYRRHSQDRLPIIGAAVNTEKLENQFAHLGQKRIKRSEVSHYNLPGLWLNTAYGSHGLLYALLGSRYLVSLLSNDISPIDSKISASLSPTRFLIRALKT